MADDDGATRAVCGCLVLLLMCPAIWAETAAAMTIWSWFAPWPLPFSLAQGMGMNLAVSLVTRSATHAKDDRTAIEQCAAFVVFHFIAPAFALGLAWVIHKVAL